VVHARATFPKAAERPCHRAEEGPRWSEGDPGAARQDRLSKGSADRPGPQESREAAPRRALSQTAWIGGPAAPPAPAGAAQDGVRAGRNGPDRNCNHIDLPLGTGGDTGRPKRTRYVVA